MLKNDLSLDRALQLEKKAVDIDDLSHSEPTELGRGMRKKFVSQLTSDDEEDDDDEEIAAQRPRQDNQLTAWPTPPRILQLPREPSTTAFDKRLSQVQHDVECVRKKVDYVAEELVELRADITQVKATMAEILKGIQELRLPAEARPPSLKLPLCTKEAYKAFVSELEKNASFAQDAPSVVQPGLRKPGCGHSYRVLQLEVCFVQQQDELYKLKVTERRQRGTAGQRPTRLCAQHSACALKNTFICAMLL
nr:unnamed protein product [Spirometra erinaceieuropaei]